MTRGRSPRRLLGRFAGAPLVVVARLVPTVARARWLEEWRHELDRGLPGVDGPTAAVRLVRHLAGSVADMRALRALERERQGNGLERLLMDIRSAARSLGSARRFASVGILVFATGIAATSTLLGLVDAVLVRPLRLDGADRVMQIELHERHLASGNAYVSTRVAAEVADLWARQAVGVEGVATVHDTGFENIFYLAGSGEPERLRGAIVSPSFFQVLGARARTGRLFGADDPVASRGRDVVISERLARRRFGGDGEAIGVEARLNGQSFRIAGVMPAEFVYRVDDGGPLGAPVDVWMPFEGLARIPALPARDARMASRDSVFVRLVEDSEPERVGAALDALRRRVAPDSGSVSSALVLAPLKERLVRGARAGLMQLLGAVGLLALLACVNVAGLQVVRAAERQRELTVRAALGAERRRLMRQMALEVMLLAAAGGLLALPFASLATGAVVSLAPEGVPRLGEVTLDPRAYLLVLAVTAATGLVAGLAPTTVVRRQPIEDLATRRGASAGSFASRLRAGLVAAQVALAALLLVAGGLLVRSSWLLSNVDHGMELASTTAIEVYRPYAHQPDTLAEVAYFRELLGEAASSPGVRDVALTSSAPFRARDYYRPQWRRRIVTPEYFRLLGIDLTRGRDFSNDDHGGAPAVAIINETLAGQRFGTRDPIGRPLEPDDEPGPIVVGVVEDTRHVAIDQAALAAVYLPLAQVPDPRLTLLVRWQSESAVGVAALLERLRSVDPEQPLANVASLESTLRASGPVRQRRFHLWLLACFGAAGSLMALLGLYVVVRHAAAARQGELGVRIALGATSRHVVAIVLGQGARAAAIGGAAGMVVAVGATRFLASVLYGVSPLDPATLVGVTVALVGIVLAASWLPARAALRADPARALRQG